MASFWNSIDLSFREITNPEVRLNIHGIIIPEVIIMTFFLEIFFYLCKILSLPTRFPPTTQKTSQKMSLTNSNFRLQKVWMKDSNTI